MDQETAIAIKTAFEPEFARQRELHDKADAIDRLEELLKRGWIVQLLVKPNVAICYVNTGSASPGFRGEAPTLADAIAEVFLKAHNAAEKALGK